MRAAVRVDRGYPHFGHDLQQAFIDPFAEILLAQLRVAQELSARHEIFNNAVGEVGINCRRAKSQQTRDMMGVPRAAGLNHQIAFGPQATAYQVMMHRPGCQQAVERDSAIPDATVREDNNVVALAHRRLGAAAHRLQRLSQAVLRGLIGRVDNDAAKTFFSQR